MKGVYYKSPIDFTAIMDDRNAEKVSIDQSISQHLFMLTTTPLGRCKFDDTFGTAIFEIDFDIPRSDYSIKEFISKTIRESVIRHERRILVQDIEVSIKNTDVRNIGTKRVKKKVDISIKGLVLETDRPFFYQNSFFIGPLSH
ncbi:GPW/gp25 family protein [Chryseobacterium rhizoplanae]|uniref:GPW/gp25 family protein n=1 Tax=Chryseobacterium rhizoplanae TaxID=1609531 RepID=UPI001CE2DE49|nr:GPW/gp25 family protein [Chryseobacterium rhizoplanae]UCA61768.1 GPW/gp25 family protein [Chryseobacterium rhizoplanae]